MDEEYRKRKAEIQAKIDHNNKRIGQCILLGAAVFILSMFAVAIMAMMGV